VLHYIARRLILLPITLFFIILVNFVIINLAPGDPVTITEISQDGMASRREDRSIAFGSDDRYLQFREHYGLTLPILINLWPFTTQESVQESLEKLAAGPEKLGIKQYDRLRIEFGDRSKYVMPQLLRVLENKKQPQKIRQMGIRFFVRGGTRQAYLGYALSDRQKEYNRKIAQDNDFLTTVLASRETVDEKAAKLSSWYHKNKEYYQFDPPTWKKVMLMGQTRFFRYLSRVLTLDFGTLRNDTSKTVISEVAKRFKYSLTLALLPMLFTFVLSQVFGFIMATHQNGWEDFSLNVVFLILYAIPVFVVAPFLIEKVALNHTFPFTHIPIPISGFTSSESEYSVMTSYQRFWDVVQHLCLPLIAVMYGGLAASSRLSRTAVLEVMRQDYVRTARAKGVGRLAILGKHVGRNAAITIVTSIAGSLGVVLGGSLIVETLFEINGFGKFFYDAVINRDYNVIMFSALAGSFLTLMGYLAADICYTMLDPRVSLE
jgi:peptide/nickel transport system permease protein